jgi:pimeloyl-ACP methyl ester carboxylesterase
MRATPVLLAWAALVCGVACKPISAEPAAPDKATSAEHITNLTEARRGYTTHLTRHVHLGEPAPTSPDCFRLAKYTSSAGELPAYVGVAPKDGGKHPAIIWVVGGFSNSISDIAWTPGPADNDQSATAFRESGIVMMYPCLRGGNDAPGSMEGFYGEVDDVLAAADYLRKLDYVDPQRIYLGGHSTGGTLALLAAESENHFRAIFSFGPVEDVTGYGAKYLPFDPSIRREGQLREPGRYLRAIQTPTFIFEGAEGRSNIASLRAMAKMPHSPAVHFYPIAGADHFSTLQPTERLIARKILADSGTEANIQFTPRELALPARH